MFWAIQIELFPFMNPITWRPSSLGNTQQHVHMVGHQVSFHDFALLLARQPVQYLAQLLTQMAIRPYSTFLRYFGVNTTWYLHSHVLWLRWFVVSDIGRFPRKASSGRNPL